MDTAHLNSTYDVKLELMLHGHKLNGMHAIANRDFHLSHIPIFNTISKQKKVLFPIFHDTVLSRSIGQNGNFVKKNLKFRRKTAN